MSEIAQINLENVTFEQSSIKGNFFNIVNSLELNIKSVSFLSINKNYERNSKTKFYLGGCLRTINIVKRNITKLSVVDVFSDRTTVGLKIIDPDIEKIYDIFGILDKEIYQFNVIYHFLVFN